MVTEKSITSDSLKVLFHRQDSGCGCSDQFDLIGSNPVIIIKYIVMYVAAAAAASMEKHLYIGKQSQLGC